MFLPPNIDSSWTGLWLIYHNRTGAARLSTFAPFRRIHGRHAFTSTMECKQERRFGATFPRKVRPLRICRLACPGLLDLAFRPMTSLRFRLWYCPNIWFTSIHRSELLSIGTLMIGRFSGDASICSCSWEGEHSRTIRHESIS
jgi:hypothetical protein